MADLKLSRLPDRTPVRLTISVLPDLNQRLAAYADRYAATYGVEEPVTTLIPAITSPHTVKLWSNSKLSPMLT